MLCRQVGQISLLHRLEGIVWPLLSGSGRGLAGGSRRGGRDIGHGRRRVCKKLLGLRWMLFSEGHAAAGRPKFVVLSLFDSSSRRAQRLRSGCHHRRKCIFIWESRGWRLFLRWAFWTHGWLSWVLFVASVARDGGFVGLLWYGCEGLFERGIAELA